MKKIIKKIKWLFFRIRFQLRAAEYMRVVYTDPRRVVLITSRLGEKDNIMPIDWHIPLSLFPKLYAISLETKNFTCSMILKSRCFAVNFMPGSFEKEIVACGNISGKENDKFKLTNLKKSEAKTINAPYLADAFGHIECEVTEVYPAGDHTLFVAKVLYEKLDDTAEKTQLYHITRLKR